MSANEPFPGFAKLTEMPGAFWYLASPYTKFSEGRDRAAVLAAQASAWLIDHKVHVFSPIAHSHEIAKYQRPEQNTYETWLPLDKVIAQRAHGLIVLRLPGWADSYGVNKEIEWFRARSRRIVYMPWPVGGEVPPPREYRAGGFYWVRVPLEMADDEDDQWQVAQYAGHDVWYEVHSAVAMPTYYFEEIGEEVRRQPDEWGYAKRAWVGQPQVEIKWAEPSTADGRDDECAHAPEC